MKKRFWIIIGAAVVVAGIAGWLFFGRKKQVSVEWRTAKIEKGDIRMTVRASGTLNAVTTVQVGTQVSGIIKNIYVDFNSEVREGQVIALLDTTLLAQAVEDASAALRRNEIQVNQSKREYDRTRLLFEQKVVAQADYDLALSTWETAVTNAVSARAALNRARINLRYATIIAPISGVVVSRAVDVGQTVAASFSTPTMFTIANDLTKMQVQANIDEGDIGKIQVDQVVSFTVDAYPDLTFSGTVRQVRLQPVVTQNVVNYTVIIDVPNPDLKLLPGMTANITVLVQEVKDVLKVPATALRFNPPQEYIDAYEKSLPDSVRKRREMWAGGGNRKAGGGPEGSGTRQGPGREQDVFAGSGPGTSAAGRSGSESARRMSDANTGNSRMAGNGEGRSGGMSGPVAQGPEGFGQRRRGNIGMIWIKTGDSLKPVRVRTGITDGLNTEIRGRLNEGDEVVLGIVNSQNTQAASQQQQQNPFAPQMPRGSNRGGR